MPPFPPPVIVQCTPALTQAKPNAYTGDTHAGISYVDFLEQYDGQHVEWVAGQACSLGPVTDRHQAIGGWLLTLLRTYSEERRPGEVLTRPFQMRTGPNLPDAQNRYHSAALPGLWLQVDWLWETPLPHQNR